MMGIGARPAGDAIQAPAVIPFGTYGVNPRWNSESDISSQNPVQECNSGNSSYDESYVDGLS